MFGAILESVGTSSFGESLGNIAKSSLKAFPWLDDLIKDKAEDFLKNPKNKGSFLEGFFASFIEKGGLEVEIHDAELLKEELITGKKIDREDAIISYGSTPGVKNFNPGNLRNKHLGYDVDDRGFTIFPSPQIGFAHLVKKIKNAQNGKSKVYKPDMTLVDFFNTYAPSEDDNNPDAYAEFVAKKTKISLDEPITDVDPLKMAQAIAQHEDGKSYQMLKDLEVIT